MGKGRAPCCAKVGLNKGSWTPEEDMRLIAYIQKYGHANWRALPKQAGTYGTGRQPRRRAVTACIIRSEHVYACDRELVPALTVGSSIPSIRRSAAVREELPAAVDQLPAPGPQARQLHRRGGGGHHQAPRLAREQVRIRCSVSGLEGLSCTCRSSFWIIHA
jgi:hypothetical protein